MRKISKEKYYKKYSIDHSKISTRKIGRKLTGTSQNVATKLDNGQWHSVESDCAISTPSLITFFPDVLYMCVSYESI